MPEADGYVRIKADLEDAGLVKKLSTLGARLNRELSSLEKARQNVEALEREFNRLASGETTPKSILQLEKSLANAEKEVAKLQTEYDALNNKLDERREININGAFDEEIRELTERSSLLGGQLDSAKASAEGLRTQLEGLRGNPMSTVEAQDLQGKLSVARAEVERFSADVDNTAQAMNSLRNSASGVTEEIKTRTNGAVAKLTGYIGRLAKRMIVLYAFRRVFTYIRQTISAISGLGIVTGVFSDFNNKMREAYQRNEAVTAALANLRGAMYSAFQPIYNAVVPALSSFINWLAKAIYYISAFFAALSGGKLSDSAEGAKDLAKEVGGVGGAAKQANKQLAQFDKLNTLSESSGGGGGGGGSPSATFDEGMISQAEAFGERVAEIKAKIEELLPAIELALGGFGLALGAILLFSGVNIPLGLGMIAAGAALVWKAAREDWGSVPPKVQEAVAEIMLVVSSAFMAIGVVLLFSGHIGLGIGLIIASLAGFAAVGLNWNSLTATVQNKVSGLMAIIGASLIVIGVILAFAGILPLGLGLIFAGAASLGTALALNWDGLLEKLKGAWNSIKEWWNTKVKKFFTKEYWQEKIDSMFKITPPHIPMPHFTVTWEPAGPIASFFGFDAIPHIGVQFYAEGGFPDFGSLFVAGEAGPELVGSFGGHSNSVINEAQLVQAFRQASSEQVALLQQQNSLLKEILNKSGEVTLRPSSAAGKVFKQSINLYDRAMG